MVLCLELSVLCCFLFLLQDLCSFSFSYYFFSLYVNSLFLFLFIHNLASELPKSLKKVKPENIYEPTNCSVCFRARAEDFFHFFNPFFACNTSQMKYSPFKLFSWFGS